MAVKVICSKIKFGWNLDFLQKSITSSLWHGWSRVKFDISRGYKVKSRLYRYILSSSIYPDLAQFTPNISNLTWDLDLKMSKSRDIHPDLDLDPTWPDFCRDTYPSRNLAHPCSAIWTKLAKIWKHPMQMVATVLSYQIPLKNEAGAQKIRAPTFCWIEPTLPELCS